MQCQAIAKATGKQCQRRAVGGKQVCTVHGGLSTGRPIIHGRYSLTHRQTLADKAARFLSDPTPGDLTSELALTRALLQDYLDRFQDGIPITMADIENILGMIEAVGRLVERIARILNQTALTQVEVQFLQARLVDIILGHIHDPGERGKCLDEIEAAFGVRSGIATTPRQLAAITTDSVAG